MAGPETATEEAPKASIKELNKALAAGFNDDDEYDIAPEETQGVDADEAPTVSESSKELEATIETEGVNTSDENATPVDKSSEVDEWDGVPEGLKNRFNSLTENLARVTNIAKSANGRVSKLQSQLEKSRQEAVEKPEPTAQQIQSAIGNKEKREELRLEWPDHAAALDEQANNFSTAVGAAVDNAINGLRTEMQTSYSQDMAAFATKQDLNFKHPQWETTVKSKEFKDWLYQNGPTEAEILTYEQGLEQAQMNGGSPELYKRADTYYNNLLTQYPEWSNEKGNLYGDPSGASAIELLNLYKGSVDDKTKLEQNSLQARAKDDRLEDNIPPTSGKGAEMPTDTEVDVEKAFNEGFKNG